MGVQHLLRGLHAGPSVPPRKDPDKQQAVSLLESHLHPLYSGTKDYTISAFKIFPGYFSLTPSSSIHQNLPPPTRGVLVISHLERVPVHPGWGRGSAQGWTWPIHTLFSLPVSSTQLPPKATVTQLSWRRGTNERDLWKFVLFISYLHECPHSSKNNHMRKLNTLWNGLAVPSVLFSGNPSYQGLPFRETHPSFHRFHPRFSSHQPASRGMSWPKCTFPEVWMVLTGTIWGSVWV